MISSPADVDILVPRGNRDSSGRVSSIPGRSRRRSRRAGRSVGQRHQRRQAGGRLSRRLPRVAVARHACRRAIDGTRELLIDCVAPMIADWARPWPTRCRAGVSSPSRAGRGPSHEPPAEHLRGRGLDEVVTREPGGFAGRGSRPSVFAVGGGGLRPTRRGLSLRRRPRDRVDVDPPGVGRRPLRSPIGSTILTRVYQGGSVALERCGFWNRSSTGRVPTHDPPRRSAEIGLAWARRGRGSPTVSRRGSRDPRALPFRSF